MHRLLNRQRFVPLKLEDRFDPVEDLQCLQQCFRGSLVYVGPDDKLLQSSDMLVDLIQPHLRDVQPVELPIFSIQVAPPAATGDILTLVSRYADMLYSLDGAVLAANLSPHPGVQTAVT